MDNLDRGERKSEREAMAFVNELLSCAGELKNNLKSLQHKCEVGTKHCPIILVTFAEVTNKGSLFSRRRMWIQSLDRLNSRKGRTKVKKNKHSLARKCEGRCGMCVCLSLSF